MVIHKHINIKQAAFVTQKMPLLTAKPLCLQLWQVIDQVYSHL